ncbi:MAG: SET domain-containing protein-lysine N-methyltransferase [Gammaproteobacteria bacterium]|nr:SET domain-containing protein-lysine N-methyltransferase [Gammaproteobacteria bacterium]
MKVYVKDSPQHGKGVFSARPLRAGEAVLTFTGPLLHRAQLDPHDYHLQIGDESYLGPSGEADDYVNHSCAPNSGFRAEETLYALRDIAAHEEITWDYSSAIDEADFTGFPCGCGAARCRGRVSSFRDLDTASRIRLAPHLLPYLKLKYALPELKQA